MESDKEILSKIVSERADEIQSEAIEQIKRIQEHSEKELSRIIPDLMKQIESFSIFKLLDVLEIIRNGGVVKTGEYNSHYDDNRWTLSIGGSDPFYDGAREATLDKGQYRITLIMQKITEEAES